MNPAEALDDLGDPYRVGGAEDAELRGLEANP